MQLHTHTLANRCPNTHTCVATTASHLQEFCKLVEKRVINSLSDCSLLLHYGAETNTKHLSLKTAAHTNTHTHAQLRQDEEELTDSYYSETGNRQAVPVKRPSFTKVATAAQSYLPTASSTWRLNMSAHWKQHVTDPVLEYFFGVPLTKHTASSAEGREQTSWVTVTVGNMPAVCSYQFN